MFNIDIERLMDLVDEESNTYFDYCRKGKNLYKGPFDELEKRKESYMNAYHYHDRRRTQRGPLLRFSGLTKTR